MIGAIECNVKGEGRNSTGCQSGWQPAGAVSALPAQPVGDSPLSSTVSHITASMNWHDELRDVAGGDVHVRVGNGKGGENESSRPKRGWASARGRANGKGARAGAGARQGKGAAARAGATVREGREGKQEEHQAGKVEMEREGQWER